MRLFGLQSHKFVCDFKTNKLILESFPCEKFWPPWPLPYRGRGRGTSPVWKRSECLDLFRDMEEVGVRIPVEAKIFHMENFLRFYYPIIFKINLILSFFFTFKSHFENSYWIIFKICNKRIVWISSMITKIS